MWLARFEFSGGTDDEPRRRSPHARLATGRSTAGNPARPEAETLDPAPPVVVEEVEPEADPRDSRTPGPSTAARRGRAQTTPGLGAAAALSGGAGATAGAVGRGTQWSPAPFDSRTRITVTPLHFPKGVPQRLTSVGPVPIDEEGRVIPPPLEKIQLAERLDLERMHARGFRFPPSRSRRTSARDSNAATTPKS